MRIYAATEQKIFPGNYAAKPLHATGKAFLSLLFLLREMLASATFASLHLSCRESHTHSDMHKCVGVYVYINVCVYISHSVCVTYMCLVSQWYLTLCNPMYCSLPVSSVQGILQARILELVVMPSSRESS